MVFCFLGIVIIYFQELKNAIFKEDIYIVFDAKQDQIKYKESIDKKIYPYKFITINKNKRVFGVKVDQITSIEMYGDRYDEINSKKLKSLNTISIDSFAGLIPHLTYLWFSKPRNEIPKNFRFNVIEIDKGRIFIRKVKTRTSVF